jgi:hypothetical protein
MYLFILKLLRINFYVKFYTAVSKPKTQQFLGINLHWDKMEY